MPKRSGGFLVLLKNMFFVINKEKVYAYVVSILTIVILFFMSHLLNSDDNTDMVSSNYLQENVINDVVSTDTNVVPTDTNNLETDIVPN